MTHHIHIIPAFDLREHDLSDKCWCRPTEDDIDDDVMIHHALDQREKYESGELKEH